MELPDFFNVKGPGKGDRATNKFMKELCTRARIEFDHDYSEQQICGENKLAVDFYFPEESSIIEVALSLRNSTSEYERDIFKALLAKDSGYQVSRLLFITKPGGHQRINQPGAKSIANWVKDMHGITTDVVELDNELRK